MTDPQRESGPPHPSPEEAPGLPGLSSWRQVYILVLGVFAVLVGLLLALPRLLA